MTAFPLSGRRVLRAATAPRGRWSARALVVVTALAVTVLSTGAPAANATFSDSVAPPSMRVGAGTVAPATNVRVETSCTTTTTVIQRTFQTTASGGLWQTGYRQTSSTATSTSNVESDVTTRTDGPGVNQYTTTRTIKDTELYATARWGLSTSARVTGYRMTAHTVYGPVLIGEPGPITTSMTRRYDAGVLSWNPRLSIDTLTDYGWIGTSQFTRPVTC
ncbi:hypothetical protein SAMN05660642_01444 [Geodermatophilus siccatus]|uniref:Uncharacterized protein n=1 Tax=Geodermatophilus siccatus TaxID=1137991 RepID=A0A1G9Q081_9ACTN|nr:hypothetical protein [Geodermatophilus siccatus]SDM04399.1 hypothetical protein SAMN05660642_01444 [Geodermatophilus siccatus]